MQNLSMSFVVTRDDKKFWVSYDMECISYDRATENHPLEAVYEFIEESAVITCIDDEKLWPMTWEEVQEIARDHAKGFEVHVG